MTLRAVVVLGALLGAAACSSKPESPEAQVKAFVERAEKAAAEGDVGALQELVSDAYRGPGGQDKEALGSMLTFHFLRHKRVYTLTRIVDLQLPEPDRARLGLITAAAATPLDGARTVTDIRGDVFRFDLDLARDDDEWRVTRAAWRRADPADLLGP